MGLIDWALKNLLCGSDDAPAPAVPASTEAAPATTVPPINTDATEEAADAAAAAAAGESPPLTPALGAKWDGDALLEAGELAGLKFLGKGKVRDLYEVDADHLLMVSTDRISAFDVVMLNGVPGKGKVLNQLTEHWLSLFEAQDLIPHHLVTAEVTEMPAVCRQHSHVIAGRSMLVKKLEMLPVEAVVRGYITGSGWKDYVKSGAVCGIDLPSGLSNCEQLPKPLFTPSTKAEYGAHDENISIDAVIAEIGEVRAREVESTALALYNAVADYAASRGVIVADTKMEFGLDEKGAMVIGDECFTPDCSRYWPAEGYEKGQEQDSFDKQYVRNYLTEIEFDKKTPIKLPVEVVERTIQKYTQIFEILTGNQPRL